MSRGPVFTPPPRLRKKAKPPSAAFAGPRGDCDGCQRGDGRLPCTCVVQDRCSAVDDSSRQQCILGAGHALRHTTATGKHWR